MSVGTLGTASINSTKTIVRTVTEDETNQRLEYQIMRENGLMHRVEFFHLVQVAPEPDKLDSGLSGVATHVTKGTDLAYPSLRKDCR